MYLLKSPQRLNDCLNIGHNVEWTLEAFRQMTGHYGGKTSATAIVNQQVILTVQRHRAEEASASSSSQTVFADRQLIA